MSQTTTRTRSTKIHWGRARKEDPRTEPSHVSEEAQAKIDDPNNTLRTFDFYSSSQRERGKLPERPSTSGGPVKSSMRKDAGNRETKDDLHFNPLAAHGKGTLFYNFPRPGALPTPASSPKSKSKSKPLPPLQQRSTKPRSDTPESIPDAGPAIVMNVHRQYQEELPIGMALGSPAHPPSEWQDQSNGSSWLPQPQNNSNMSSISPEQDIAVDGRATPQAISKPKGSRWKLLGGLFGAGRKNSEPQPFYQLQPEPNHKVTLDADTGDFVESHVRPKSRGRTLTGSERRSEKKKPDIMRSNTLPVDFGHYSVERSKPPEIIIHSGHNSNSANHDHNYKSQGLLNIDIPTIQMERYSIMFGSVLQKSENTAVSSSLLARRQATLDRLKTVNEALASKERELDARARLLKPRRATSPQPTKSPAFSLFPSTPSRLAVHDTLPSPLQRSNTSPAALSPARPSFSRNSQDHEMKSSLKGPAPHMPQPAARPKLSASFRKKPESKPNLKSASNVDLSKVASHHQKQPSDISQEESHLDFGSDDEDVYHQPLPLKPKLDEPTWRMVTSTSGYGTTTSISGGSSSSRSDGHSTSTSASSITTSSPNSSIPTQKQVEIQAVPATRRKRAATASSAARSLPRPAEVSNAAFGAPSSSVHISSLVKPTSTAVLGASSASVNIFAGSKPVSNPTVKLTDNAEDRLKSAADISIARQISVSRQQRQLLIPIKKANSIATSTATPQRMQHNSNFPTPASMNLTRSPLQTMSDPESPITGTPLVRPRMVTVKPSTPTLVVTGDDAEQTVKAWGGQTAANSPAFVKNESGEIRIGLQTGSPIGDRENRKSERVILERVH